MYLLSLGVACPAADDAKSFPREGSWPEVLGVALGSEYQHRVQPQVSVVSSIIATLFLRTTLHSSSVSDGQTYLGLIFFAIIHMVRELSLSQTHLACCI